MAYRRKRKELGEGVLVYVTKTVDPWTYTFELESSSFEHAHLTIDFKGSRNYVVEGSDDMKVSASVGPFGRCKVCTVKCADEKHSASLHRSYSYTTSPASNEETDKSLQQHNKLAEPLLEEARFLPFAPGELDPSNAQVHEVCCNYGKTFIDKEFPHSIASLVRPGAGLSFGETAYVHSVDYSKVVWRRACDFLAADYAVFDEGIGPEDIRQGGLGDCWFLAAVAALAEFPVLIQDIVETKEVNGDGCYRVKFCKNGQWQSVRVDDYFPCYPAAGPVYCKSNGDELWAMLLEKAYAKLHGSYQAIRAGVSFHAMMDMTGAPHLIISCKNCTEQEWKDLLAYDAQNYVMTASAIVDDEKKTLDRKGIVGSHAYSLIAVKESKEGHRLLQLRNPWGYKEWNGDWGDRSPLWTPAMMEEMGRVEADDMDAYDGLFWMSFEDFKQYFVYINVCMVRREGLHPTPWIERRSCFHYKLDQDSGAVSAPAFLLEVQEDGEFIVGVHQTDERCYGVKPYMDIGVTVMKEDDKKEGKYTFVEACDAKKESSRQKFSGTLELSAGKYLVCPTTTGTKLKQQLAEEAGKKSAATVIATEDAAGNKVLTQAVLQTHSQIFDRFDRDNDGYLSQADMSAYTTVVLGEELVEEAFQLLMKKFESGEDAPGLSKVAFLNAVQASFVAGGADEDKMRSGLSKLGYDASLWVESGRSAVLSIHGTTPYTLVTKESNEDVYERAVIASVIKNGKLRARSEGKIKEYKLDDSRSVTWVVENAHDTPLRYELDVTDSKNVASNRDCLKFEQIIWPGEAKLMLKITPTSGYWSYNSKPKFSWLNESEKRALQKQVNEKEKTVLPQQKDEKQKMALPKQVDEKEKTSLPKQKEDLSLLRF